MSYDVSLDPTFQPDEVEAIVTGLEEWQESIPELHVTYSVSTCDSPAACQVCFHPDHSAPDPSHDVIGSTFPGSSDDSKVLIYVDRIRATGWEPSALTAQTAAHEMGHAIGLRHTGAQTLMAADVPDQAHGVTPTDVAQFWSVRGK